MHNLSLKILFDKNLFDFPIQQKKKSVFGTNFQNFRNLPIFSSNALEYRINFYPIKFSKFYSALKSDQIFMICLI